MRMFEKMEFLLIFGIAVMLDEIESEWTDQHLSSIYSSHNVFLP